MSKLSDGDIWIGDDEWIRDIEITGRDDHVVSLDHFSSPIKDFSERLETECVAECCGIKAFNFSRQNIHRASQECTVDALAGHLSAMKQFIQQAESEVYVSGLLNQLFDGRVAVQLIDHIIKYLVPRNPVAGKMVATQESATWTRKENSALGQFLSQND